MGAFCDFFGVVLTLLGLSVEHFFGFEHDLVGFLCFFIILKGELDIFQELFNLMILLHRPTILPFKFSILFFQFHNNPFLFSILLPQRNQILMHFNGLNCDRFFVFISIVLEGLLFGYELLGMGLLLLGIVLGKLVLFLVEFLLVLVETVGDEGTGGLGGGGVEKRGLHWGKREEVMGGNRI